MQRVTALSTDGLHGGYRPTEPAHSSSDRRCARRDSHGSRLLASPAPGSKINATNLRIVFVRRVC